MQQIPSLGRIVIYTTTDGKEQAAMVCHVHNDELINVVSWNEFGSGGSYTSVRLGEGPGTWNWPKRV